MEEDAIRFMKYINDNYQDIYNSFLAFCHNKNYKFDEDIFQDTIIKCYNLIEKQGYLKDTTEKGMKNYFFMAFKINTIRAKQYAAVAKRDGNVVNLNGIYEAYSNQYKLTEQEKLLSDLYKDYAVLYLLKKVEENFDNEHFYLFRLKTFENITYQQLAEHTGLKGVRQKVVTVKNWLKQNVSRDEVKKAFEEDYGDLLI